MSPARTLLSALALAALAWTAPAAAQVVGDWNEYKLLPAPPKGQAPHLGAPKSAQPGTAPALLPPGRAAPNSAPGAPPRTWDHGYEFRPGKWAQTDYGFDLPSPPNANSDPSESAGLKRQPSAGAVRASPPDRGAALKKR